MKFDIRLVYNIKAIPIAQLIPIGMIRIMGTTHCIDIILLHQLYILQHQLFTHHTTLFRELVSIHSFYQHRDSIDTKTTILNLRGFKTHGTPRRFYYLPLLVFQIDNQRIKIRMLGIPRFNIRNNRIKRYDTVSHRRTAVLCDHSMIGIE